jgi:hypothetical protein
MARNNLFSSLLAATLALTFVGTADAGKAKKKKPTPAQVKASKPPPVSAEHKKALADQMGAYKFGMAKDEVLGVLTKQIDESYAEQIKATTDIYVQDNLRKEKKKEIDRIKKSYLAFEGKKSGWDVSLIEDQFAHKTGEAMLVHWENQGGKNQRRFFFFWDGKLYKMFLSLDTSVLPEDKRNFETIKAVMTGKYGPGLVEGGRITWDTADFSAQAIDKLREYDALCLVIWDSNQMKSLVAMRTERAPAKKEMNGVVKSVLDKDDTKPPVDLNKGTVDQVINGAGKKN